MTITHDEPTPETDAFFADMIAPRSVKAEMFCASLERDRNRLRAQLAGVIERAAKLQEGEAENLEEAALHTRESTSARWTLTRRAKECRDRAAAIRSLAAPAEPVAQPQRREGHSALRVKNGVIEKFDPHPADAQPEPVAWQPGSVDWLHSFISHVSFGSSVPKGDIQKAHDIVDALAAPVAQPEPVATWLLYFDDVGVRPEMFTSEEAARARYEQASIGYNCHLFCAAAIHSLALAEPVAQAGPMLPTPFGLFVGVRNEPTGTTEFFGYLYGTTAPKEKCDLFTKEQIIEYANLYAAPAPSEDAQDAARYRRLRAFGLTEDLHGMYGEHLDTVIDAVIDKARGKP